MKPQDSNELLKGLREQVFIFIGSIITFFSPILWMFFFVGFLVSVDLIVGYNVNRIKYKENYSSEKHRATLTKFLIYSTILITAHVLEYMFNIQNLMIMNISLLYIAIGELRSLDEHYYKLKGKYIIRQIVDYIQDKFIKNKEDETRN
jgi:hypothetical protein